MANHDVFTIEFPNLVLSKEPVDIIVLVISITLIIVAIFVAVRLLQKNMSAGKWLLPEITGPRALSWFAIVLSPIWLGLFVLVIFSLARLVLDFETDLIGSDLRWHILAIVGMITALGGLVATPLALIRVFTTERQTRTAEEGLVTERFTKAVEQLGAERTVWVDGKQSSEPNIEVRLGGLYALERIAQDSERDHITIMEVICAYIRETPARRGLMRRRRKRRLLNWWKTRKSNRRT